MDKSIYTVLYPLFEYPDEGYPGRVERAIGALREVLPAAAEELQGFADLLPWHDHQDPLPVMEEIFTRSFDVQAITTLDVGYLMFGDDYKRGELLVNISREHKAAGTDCGVELGDHLSNLLKLMAAHPDREMITDLVSVILAPTMRRMVGEFEPARIEAKEKQYRKHHRTLIESAEGRYTMFGKALRSLYMVLAADFDLPGVEAPADTTQDFMEAVGKELEIEKDEGVPLGSCGGAGDDLQALNPQAKGMPK